MSEEAPMPRPAAEVKTIIIRHDNVEYFFTQSGYDSIYTLYQQNWKLKTSFDLKPNAGDVYAVHKRAFIFERRNT